MSSQPYPPGARIGKYEILDHIADGGMGTVYKARDAELGRVVALKVLLPNLTSHTAALERFRREARSAARLSHPNIVTLFECGQVEDVLYLAMEFIDGIDLGRHITDHGGLDPEEARVIAMQAVRALDHASRQGVIHRDVKPSNFLLTFEEGQPVVKLTDLGLARMARDEDFRVTRDGSTVGTVDYMSPEQARDSALADVRSDIYSLGCTLYDMLAGRPPFAEGGIGERVYKHQNVDPPDVRGYNRAVSAEFWEILQRMLAKKPDDRYQTPSSLLRDLQGVTARAARPGRAKGAGVPREDLPPPRSQVRTVEMPIPADESLQAVDEVAAGADTLAGSSTDQNLAAARQFERAREVLSGGNHEYARHLLLTCCSLDPANLHYRRALRKTNQAAVGRGTLSRWMGSLAVLAVKAKLQMAKRAGDHQKVLQHGEEVLARSPDDVGVQLEMAAAAEAMQLLPLAVWLAEQAREQHPKNVAVLRALAELYERQKKFSRAFSLWELLKKEAPLDPDAQSKMNELAAKETIERGGYKGRLARGSKGRRDSIEDA